MIAFEENHPDDEDDQVGVGNDGAEHGGVVADLLLVSSLTNGKEISLDFVNFSPV